MEPEGAPIGHVHLVFDVLLRGGEIAGVAGLARAVPSPLLDRLILRQRPGKDLLSDEGADVAALLLLDYRAFPPRGWREGSTDWTDESSNMFPPR